ncbi:hypothetical protein [Nocardioides sp. NPDC006303]|uniref:hypothetical protein n=1 Tax=Nocardioides sp. NPDC006303 TaxID=3156747 RepID=UPI0033A2840D
MNCHGRQPTRWRGDLYSWIPIVVPLVGGLSGAGAYKVLITRFLPTEEEAEETSDLPAAA